MQESALTRRFTPPPPPKKKIDLFISHYLFTFMSF